MFELPGCFSRGSSREDALDRAPRAIADYFNWRDGYERVSDEVVDSIHVQVVEAFENYETLDGYWVNSFFEYDRRPPTAAEVDDVRWLLNCTRSDLITTIRRAPSSSLDEEIAGERFGSLSGILKHVATAERWYFDKLGLALPKEQLGTDPFGMLDAVRRHTVIQLPRLVQNREIREIRGELWSARKVVRRMLWHERVHTWHLQRLVADM